ncbi:MAG: hypothetical protein WDN04_27120 [Rhodospirillales bacterium]
MPDFLDLVGRDRLSPGRRQFRQRDFCKPRLAPRATHRDQFQYRIAHIRPGGIEPAAEDFGSFAFGADCKVSTTVASVGGVRSRLGRPHQGNGLGQVTDEIVRQAEQHRIGSRLGQVTDQTGLGRGKTQFAVSEAKPQPRSGSASVAKNAASAQSSPIAPA